MPYTLDKNRPIAVFDSGMGGISVLKELLKVMPNEDYLYFGDSANAPYGTKSKDQVCSLTLEHAKNFLDEGVKGIVVACNTATSAAVRVMRQKYPEVPIVGIEPAVKPASQMPGHPKVLVLATPMTIREEKFQNLMHRFEEDAEILPMPCPGLMEFVERGDLKGDDLKEYLENLLAEYKDNQVDAAVLGCTHYPFVREMIQKTLGDEVRIFDGGEGTAREMRRRLEAEGLLTDSPKRGRIEFRNSLADPAKLELCKWLLYH